MSKKAKCNFIINLQLYDYDLVISCGETDKELEPKLKKHGAEEDERHLWEFPGDKCRGRFCQFRNGGFLIRLRNIPITSNEFGTLAHEIFHVVNVLMELDMKMKLRFGKNDEAWAHLVGYITENVYKGLNKHY